MFDLFNRRPLHRSVVSAAALTAAAVVALSGCSGPSAAEVEDSATSGSIDWWGWTPEIGVGQQYIDLFNKEFPDIEVNYKQVATADYDSIIRPALASNVGPDVFNMAPGGGIGSIQVYEGSAIDLTPAITDALGDDWSSKIAEIGPLGLTTEAGKLAALPIGSVFAGPVWINPDIFAEHGLTPPTTYEEWIDVCAKFAAEDQTCFELGAGDNGFNQDLLHAIANSIEPGIWSKAVAGDAEWTDPALVQAMTTFEEMFHNGIIQEGAQGMQQYPDVNNDFLSGKTAMVMMGTWYMQYSTVQGATAAVSAAGVADAQPFPMVNIPFPDITGAGNPAPLFGDADYGLAVNVKSQQPKAAQTFVTWLTTSEDAQQLVANALNDIPSLNGITPTWDTVELVDAAQQQGTLDDLLERASGITEPRLGDINSALGQAIGVATGAVASGSESPRDALSTLQSTVGSN